MCILAVIYGIVVKSRKYFNIGYFVFGIDRDRKYDIKITKFLSDEEIENLAKEIKNV